MNKYSTFTAALIVLGSTSAALAKSDTSFLTDAIQINLAEIAVGDLAQKNGASDDVKAFGKMLVDDHTASNQKATSLAQANGVTPPNEPKPADKEAEQHLATLSGPEFDREFTKAMVKGHKEAIGKFEAASKGDDDIAKFAQDTLPTLQKHLEQAKSIAGKETETPIAAFWAATIAPVLRRFPALPSFGNTRGLSKVVRLARQQDLHPPLAWLGPA